MKISSMSEPDYRFATVHGEQIHWYLPRNCSIAPAQLGWLYAALCCTTLGIALAFYIQGAGLILPFAALELIALAAALLVYARHAGDVERIALSKAHLVVEIENGGKSERAQFPRELVRVQPLPGYRALISISANGQSIDISRHVPPDMRPLLAQEIKRALRT